MPDRAKVINELNDCLENQHISFIDDVGNIYAVSEETIRNVLTLIENIKMPVPIGYTTNGMFYKSGG